MMSWKLSLLFFSAVTLHGCLSGAAEPEVQDGSSIKHITNLYNQMEDVTYLYKSLDQHPATPLEEGENQRCFIIKETECLKSENPDLSQCDFKSDGDVKLCDLHAEVPEDIKCIILPEVFRERRSTGRPRRRPCPPRRPGCSSIIARKFHLCDLISSDL
ncbi:cathelicidin-related peptide Oh-Cath-like [Eleutherodactylus coqui]|uniref:cathelicidin-related peptide Oh-Cath-like n=1 Tax=Eleutherodactylus coqui TaxID=57060 RepID=UPI003462212D